jgi:hypothetical protein
MLSTAQLPSYLQRECNICHSSNAGAALKILFSSCCGYVVYSIVIFEFEFFPYSKFITARCEPCLTNSIFSGIRTFSCPLCVANLTKNSFDTSDFDCQKANRDFEARIRVEKWLFIIIVHS